LQVVATCAIAAAFAGYFAGLRPPERHVDPRPPHATASAGRAPSYQELRELRRGPNGTMYDGAVGVLAHSGLGSFDPATQPGPDAETLRSLRASRRAYEGAPPTIPHAIEQRGHPDCLSCHEHGARIAGHIAPRPTHAFYQSCTQCHVVSSDPRVARPGAAPNHQLAQGSSP
jgi:nitrate reductase (cytochrome), electron transfer subunit